METALDLSRGGHRPAVMLRTEHMCVCERERELGRSGQGGIARACVCVCVCVCVSVRESTGEVWMGRGHGAKVTL